MPRLKISSTAGSDTFLHLKHYLLSCLEEKCHYCKVSSLNPHYTFHYSQPENYRFSHDSVFLARRVYEDLSPHLFNIHKALDLCAGCGIVGLDLLFHLKSSSHIKTFDFIEVQQTYSDHFVKNQSALKNLLPEQKTECHFLNMNYSDALHDKSLENKYDLIVCNPPYFKPEQGKLSDDDFKNRCRFFLDSDFKTLIEFIGYSLNPNGLCYMIFHDLKDHKIDLTFEIQHHLGHILKIEKLDPIRKSIFLKISKK